MAPTELEKSLALLKAGCLAQPCPGLQQRKDWLHRIANLLTSNETELCAALSADFGYRSAQQSSFADISTTLKSIGHALRNLRFWMQDEPRSAELSLRMSGARCHVEYQPKGVVGIVSPWNFPLNLALSPLVSALAAGNRAFIKPSEITPRTAALLAELITDHFAANEVAVALGGAEIAAAFTALEFDHLIYTGSTGIGRQIMAASAKHLTPLTLELGGKCPVVVSESGDIDKAVSRILFGKYFNAGQICIAPDYVLLPEARLDEFLEALTNQYQKVDRANRQGDAVSVASASHAERLRKLVEDACEKGARHYGLGQCDQQSSYQLEVLVNPAPEADVCWQEIFGPVLLIQTVSSFDACVAAIRARPSPLAVYYFGKNKAEQNKLRNETLSGALVFNDIIFQYANDDIPFGGVGASGIGRYRGIDGFKEFSNQRAIYRTGIFDLSALVTPPYPRGFNIINRLMRKL